MNSITLWLIVFLSFRTIMAISPTDRTAQQSTDSQTAWREDLHVMAERMEAMHRDLFWRVSEDEFRNMVRKLDADIPYLTNEQIIVELARIVSIADAHSHLSLYQSAAKFQVYPLRLYFFQDGLFIVDAIDPSLIGAEITAINGHSVQDVYDTVAPLVTHDNLHGLRNLLPSYIIGPQILQALGLIDDISRANIALRYADGGVSSINPQPIKPGDTGWEEWYMSSLPQRAEPLYLSQHIDQYFWFTFLPDTQTLYIQYNWISATNTDGETMFGFAKSLEEFVANNNFDRVVLDLRHNAGGNNTTYRPLLRLLTSNERINQPNKFFTLIGRRTFSAAANLVIDLEKNSHTTFVGEPMGDTPNMYGDPIPFTLPNSKLIVAISSRFWEKSPNDPRDTVEPDIFVELTSADYFNQTDPVLEAVLKLPI